MNTLLRDTREKLRLSIEEVAARADTSASTVYRAENDPRRVSRNNLKRICGVLKLNLQQVLEK